MREIKFRAWNKTGKNIVDLYKITPLALSVNVDGLFLPFHDDYILEQFTGLFDKNGKEIYEGDIVDYFETQRFGAKHETDTIIFDGGVFRMKRKYGQPLKHCCEVIGNIHQHKELLETDNG